MLYVVKRVKKIKKQHCQQIEKYGSNLALTGKTVVYTLATATASNLVHRDEKQGRFTKALHAVKNKGENRKNREKIAPFISCLAQENIKWRPVAS